MPCATALYVSESIIFNHIWIQKPFHSSRENGHRSDRDVQGILADVKTCMKPKSTVFSSLFGFSEAKEHCFFEFLWLLWCQVVQVQRKAVFEQSQVAAGPEIAVFGEVPGRLLRPKWHEHYDGAWAHFPGPTPSNDRTAGDSNGSETAAYISIRRGAGGGGAFPGQVLGAPPPPAPPSRRRSCERLQRYVCALSRPDPKELPNDG